MSQADAESCSLYILQSVDADKYYVGVSFDPLRRLEFHNSMERGFTCRYRPWKIVFTKRCSSRKDALKLERKIKSWKSRIMVEKVIHGEIEL